MNLKSIFSFLFFALSAANGRMFNASWDNNDFSIMNLTDHGDSYKLHIYNLPMDKIRVSMHAPKTLKVSLRRLNNCGTLNPDGFDAAMEIHAEREVSLPDDAAWEHGKVTEKNETFAFVKIPKVPKVHRHRRHHYRFPHVFFYRHGSFPPGLHNFLDKTRSSLHHFMVFRHMYSKAYKTVGDLLERFTAFEENLERIHEHNSRKLNYTLGVNEYADMTPEQFTLQNLGCTHKKPKKVGFFMTRNACYNFQPANKILPDTVDWRDKDVVTPVKNQGHCGSCWSFSATGSMEGAWALKTGNLVSLSEQQLVDCSQSYGNNGCNGGMMDDAFKYAMDNGMCTEEEDPYTAADGTCKKCEPVVSVKNCVDVTPENQMHLKEAVARGPVSVAIEADTSVFQLYSGGVVTSTKCGQELDHGVLVVGYGEDNGVLYWLVKNSWGDQWGDDGYVKIERSESSSDPGVCGIAMQPSYPVC